MRQFGEPMLGLIDPRGTGWRYVDLPARTFGQPFPDLCALKLDAVVHDEMQALVAGGPSVDLLQELMDLFSLESRELRRGVEARGGVEGDKERVGP